MKDIFAASDLDAGQFLSDYWQQKPLLLRQAFPDFQPELDADDIAGLACDEMAEARLITGRYPGADWSLRHGPFSERDFAALPEREWTLLVQDVEKHYPPLRELFDAFRFLPNWRIDDLMASVAGPGGSVGPHVDQYDVFLLQAAGRRLWQIAESFDSALLPDCDLNVLEAFEAGQEWSLDPGDMLYLPPGIAHHGVAAEGTEPCMTWSIGMRAPSAADLLQSLGEWLAGQPGEGGRYRDPAMGPSRRAGEIDSQAVRRLRDLAREAIDDPARWPEFLGSFLSGYRLTQEPAAPAHTVDPSRLRQKLRSGARLHHHPWTRLAWTRTVDGALLFAAGSAFACPSEVAALLCDPEVLAAAPADVFEACPDLIAEMVNRGHLVLETV